MSSVYLPQNLEILAYSSGYTVDNFFKKVGIAQSSVWDCCKNQKPLLKKHEDNILRFVGNSGQDWLLLIFNMCYHNKNLDRVDACLFDRSTDEYSEDMFLSNVHKLRYFLSIGRREISARSYISISGYGRIESGEKKKISEDEYNAIDRALHDRAYYELGQGALDIWDLAHRHRILNMIPPSAHCVHRKKYTRYNEETQTTILKGE